MPQLPYDGTAINASDSTISTYSRLQYPNPFFDLSRHYFPKTVKTLFKYCRIYYYQNEFINNVITKLAEYPITDFIYEGLDDKEVKKNYKQLIDHYLNLKSFLIEVGLDYFTYGNCIVSANMKFKRFLKCPLCQEEFPAENVTFRWVNYNFIGKCEKCSNDGVTFKIVDKYLKSPQFLKFIKWAPENINIDYDDLTGESRYFYTMNDKTNKAIREGKPEILLRVPELFINAIKNNRKIELDPRNLFHFKRPTLAEEDQGWGKPLLLPTMKMLWYMQTLRRGNEAIVADHLIPNRAIYPAAQANLDPFCLTPDSMVLSEHGIIRAGDLKVGDVLQSPKGTTTIVKLNKLDVGNKDQLYNLQSYGNSAINITGTSIHPVQVLGKNGIEWKALKDITQSTYTAYPRHKFNSILTKLPTNVHKLRKHIHHLPKNIPLTGDVFRFFGLYLAEGCAVENGKVEFCFNSKEYDYINHVTKVMDSWLPNSKTKIRKGNGNYKQLGKYSVELKEFIVSLLGARCEEKTIKNLYPYLNTNRIWKLLQGIFEGDGTFFYEQGRYPRLHLKSKNLSLLVEIKDLLISLGYYPSLVKDHSFTEGIAVGNCYQLKLQGYQAEQVAKKFGWKPKNYYTKADVSDKFILSDNYVFTKVEKIQPSKKHIIIAFEVDDPGHAYLSPGYINHNTQLNMGQWRSNVEDQVLKWRRDPNSIGIFPIPLGIQSFGGDARMLMVTPELKYLEESIINALGVPIEFIKGGSTWTSSSVSLRIVENHFLTYREQLDKFINYFIVPKIRYFLGYPPVVIRLKSFKMMDDVQNKEILLQAAQLGKISDATLLAEWGIDVQDERENRKNEIKIQSDIQTETILAQADAQGKALVRQARYQVRAQYDATEEMARIRESKFAAELVKELQLTNVDPSDFLEKQSLVIEGLDPKRQQEMLMIYQTQAPVAFGFIMKRLQNLSGIDPAMIAQSQMEQQTMKQEESMNAKQHERDLEKAKVDEKRSSSDHERKIEGAAVDMAKKEHDVEMAKKMPKKEAKK